MIDQIIYSKTKWLMGRDLLNLEPKGQEYDLLIESNDVCKMIKVYESDLKSTKLEKTHLELLKNTSILLHLLRKYGYSSTLKDLDWKTIPFLKIRGNLQFSLQEL